MPVSRNAHQTQLPATPFCRTRSVTRLGVPAENVVATIDMPSSHHGMPRPDRKNSVELLPARLATARPMASVSAMNVTMMVQSIASSVMEILFRELPRCAVLGLGQLGCFGIVDNGLRGRVETE